ncbi:MAG: hypothetical protein AAGH15_09045 [Myxococcota bacterium]
MRRWLVAALVLLACGRPDVGVAETLAAPHLPALLRFERWAVRALEGDPTRSRAQVEATLFAPFRLEGDLLGAEVEVGPPRARRFTYRAGDEVGAVRLTRVRMEGREVGVAQARLSERDAIVLESRLGQHRVRISFAVQ